MEDLHQRAVTLQGEIRAAADKLGIPAALHQKETLDAKAMQPDFWNDPAAAQLMAKQQAKLAAKVGPWQLLLDLIADTAELAALDDESLQADLEAKLTEAQDAFVALKEQLKLAGPYDDYDAIVSIYAGAGGTDAQDWAQMLLRMYVRWAEQHAVSIQTIDNSPGDEAGIKSVTMELSGPFVYGKLKGEHGVHRLVRLSPFNANSLRQTSFAKVDVMPKVDRPDELVLDDKDLRIDVYRAGGHGGQSVNTTDSAVRVTHLPTGLTVAIQNERSQLQNKETALTILRSRLIRLQMEQHKEHLDELKGPSQSAEWGNQIRSYVLHPYKQVKDLRTRYESSDVEGALDGSIDPLIEAYLDYSLGEQQQ
ncbi:MAG TPA: peptide chain release factor 2 [Candidatus Saccharimonadales bacterium]|nr:peptide chain release factor 2 [Candidatus Saccharimonadales bacterium]